MLVQKYVPLVARTFIAIIFIQTGIVSMTEFTDTQQQIADVGIPLSVLVALCVSRPVQLNRLPQKPISLESKGI